MSAAREVLVESRTKLVNNVRGWLRRFVSKLPSGDTSTFAQRVRRHKKEIPNYIERVLRAVEALSTQIEEADKELLKVATDNQAIARLMTMPGLGPVTAVRFFSALDEVNRFHNAHAVESYLGIVPGEDSSSERKRITSITKAGSTKVRWTLIQAAWVAWRCKPTAPMSLWATRVAERRGRRVAVTALARKMAGILYAMWRDEKDYDNNHQPNPQSQNGWERLEAHLAN
jgi:transposase